MKLPAGVKLHNLSTGKTSKAGANVEICGGTKFYLSASLTQVSDVAESWSTTMKGSITKDYSAYKISTGSGNQDLAKAWMMKNTWILKYPGLNLQLQKL